MPQREIQRLKNEGIYIQRPIIKSSVKPMFSAHSGTLFSKAVSSENVVKKNLNMEYGDVHRAFFSNFNYEYLSSRIAEIVENMENVAIKPPSSQSVRAACADVFEEEYAAGNVKFGNVPESVSNLNKKVIKESVKNVVLNLRNQLHYENTPDFTPTIINYPKSTDPVDKVNFYY